MRRQSTLAVLVIGLFICTAHTRAEEFIRVQQNSNGGYSFGQGDKAFYSMGVCHAEGKLTSRDGQGKIYDGIKLRGSVEAWADHATKRMAQWGLNTAGAWCDESINQRAPYQARYVWLSSEVDGNNRRLLNVFSHGYEQRMDELCQEFVAPHRDETKLIGWFLDNELPWFGEFGWPTDPQRTLLDLAFELPADDPNRHEAIKFLQKGYGEFIRFAADWDTEANSWADLEAGGKPVARSKTVDRVKQKWAGVVAERFFTVCVAAVKKHDPNHLILGCRFAGNAPGPVLAACAKHCDVVSINHYVKDGHIDPLFWDQLYGVTQKPILLTEFSWRAAENRSSNGNTQGADVTVATQQDRASRYQQFVGQLMQRPYMLGAHWFEWADQPEHGRYDGENSNYGLVDWQDEGYELLTAAIQKTIQSLPAASARGGSLPAASDRDGLVWNAKPLPTIPSGSLATPVELAKATASVSTPLDEAGGSRAKVYDTGDEWKIDFNSGKGWGLNLMFAVPEKTNLAGARRVRLRYTGTLGAKFNIMFMEQGDDQPPATPTAGVDGECWMSDLITAGPGSTTVEIELREFELNLYHGNQHGNRVLNLEAIRGASLYFPGNQGSGTVRVISFEMLEL